MKLGLLAGNDKLDILDLQQEGLPLIKLLKKAELFVISNIRRRFVFGEPGMQQSRDSRNSQRGCPRGYRQCSVSPRLHHRHGRRSEHIHGLRRNSEPRFVSRRRLEDSTDRELTAAAWPTSRRGTATSASARSCASSRGSCILLGLLQRALSGTEGVPAYASRLQYGSRLRSFSEKASFRETPQCLHSALCELASLPTT